MTFASGRLALLGECLRRPRVLLDCCGIFALSSNLLYPGYQLVSVAVLLPAGAEFCNPGAVALALPGRKLLTGGAGLRLAGSRDPTIPHQQDSCRRISRSHFSAVFLPLSLSPTHVDFPQELLSIVKTFKFHTIQLFPLREGQLSMCSTQLGNDLVVGNKQFSTLLSR